MANLVYRKITPNSTINTNANVRRLANNIYDNFTVIGYDNDEQKYILKSESGLPEYYGLECMASTEELIRKFEILEEE